MNLVITRAYNGGVGTEPQTGPDLAGERPGTHLNWGSGRQSKTNDRRHDATLTADWTMSARHVDPRVSGRFHCGVVMFYGDVRFQDGGQIRRRLGGGSDVVVQAAVQRGSGGRNARDGAPAA